MWRTPSTMSGPRPSNGPHFKAVRPVGRDIFRGRIQAVRERAARGLRPEARPDIVGASAKQQIEGLAMRREDRFSRGGIAIRQRPSAVWVVAIFIRAAGGLNHAVQRDMLMILSFLILSL